MVGATCPITCDGDSHCGRLLQIFARHGRFHRRRQWAVALPESYAEPLRLGDPAVVGRTERGRCLLDLRCVPAETDPAVLAAVLAVPVGDR